MVASTPASGIDPVLLRRFMLNYSGVDPGANPQYIIPQDIVAASGIVPVIPIANKKVPLYVYNRGWWGGGTVDVATNQIQTATTAYYRASISANTDTNLTFSVAVPAGKVFYCTGFQIEFEGAGGALFQMWDGSTSPGNGLLFKWNQNTNTISAAGNSDHWIFPIPVAFTSGAVTIQSNTAGITSLNMQGWFE